ncbi:MAG: sulfurtransferase [Chlorobiota bacterium]|jgi:rhodanese-related sulfurtransferase|nr:MAG: sulfurtransferase [Chlorobiota bacterium]
MAHSEGFLKIVDEAKAHINEVTPEQTYNKIKLGSNFILVDVREDNEWKEGYIINAIHIGKGVIERDVESKIEDKNSEIILYCGGGFRSALAASTLVQMGYTNVSSMSEGWRGWNEKEYDIVKKDI